MTTGSPLEILPELSVGDSVRLFFDRYRTEYDHTPSSPLETTVLDVTTEEVTEDDKGHPGTLLSVEFEVDEEDPEADRYWMEYREYGPPLEDQPPDYSNLLYERTLVGSFGSSGAVGNIDKIEVVDDE